VLTELLNIFSLRPLDRVWQETLASSTLVSSIRTISDTVSSKVKLESAGSFLQALSFGVTILLFAVLPLPQFTNDKEILAIFPLVSLFLWLSGKLIGGRERRQPIAADALVILYIGINILATASSHYFYPSLKGLMKVAVYVASYFVFTAQLSAAPRRKLWLALTLIAVGTLVALYGLYQYKTGVAPLATWEDPSIETKAVRIYSTLNNPNLLAGYLVPLLPISISLAIAAFLQGRWLLALLPAFSALILILATILTGSRGGYLGLIGGILTISFVTASFLWQRQAKARHFIIGAAVLLPIVSVIALHFLPSFEQRFASIFVGREHSSNSFRMNVWLSSLKMLADSWWLGVGVGNQAFVLAYGLYMHTGFDALGTYCVPLEVAVETGICGLVIFMLLVVAALCRGHFGFWREHSDTQSWLTLGAAAALISLMTHGLVDTVFYRPQVQFIFWLVLAFLLAYPQTSSNQPATRP
jgi:putative inorganic carbon (hco3(-)) transporter